MAEWRKEKRPLAVQVRDLIWAMLKEENYRPGDRLPSEQELISRFGISRGALREALKILEEERVVLCQHGVGRFVAPDPADVLIEDITRLRSTTEIATNLGITFTAQVLSACQQPAEGALLEHLELSPGELVVTLERVWCSAGKPIIYALDMFPRALVRDELDLQHFSGSLLKVLERDPQNRLEYSKTIIRAVVLDEELCQRIGAMPSMPWIMLEQINYNQRNRPVLYSKDYHCGEKFQFRVLRRRR